MSEQDYTEAPQESTSGETPDVNATPESTDAAQRPETADPRQEIAALKDQLLRKVAEFENFKRRTREEKDILIKYGTEGLIYDLLPVLDDFERSCRPDASIPTSMFSTKALKSSTANCCARLSSAASKPSTPRESPSTWISTTPCCKFPHPMPSPAR